MCQAGTLTAMLLQNHLSYLTDLFVYLDAWRMFHNDLSTITSLSALSGLSGSIDRLA